MNMFYSLGTRSIVHSYKAEEPKKSDSKNISDHTLIIEFGDVQ